MSETNQLFMKSKVLVQNRDLVMRILNELDQQTQYVIPHQIKNIKVPRKLKTNISLPQPVLTEPFAIENPELLDEQYADECLTSIQNTSAILYQRSWKSKPPENYIEIFASLNSFVAFVDNHFLKLQVQIVDIDESSEKIKYVHNKGCYNIARQYLFIPHLQTLDQFLLRLYKVESYKYEIFESQIFNLFLQLISQELKNIDKFAAGLHKHFEMPPLQFALLIKQMKLSPILNVEMGQDVLTSYSLTPGQDPIEDALFKYFENQPTINSFLERAEGQNFLDRLITDFDDNYRIVQIKLAVDHVYDQFVELRNYFNSMQIRPQRVSLKQQQLSYSQNHQYRKDVIQSNGNVLSISSGVVNPLPCDTYAVDVFFNHYNNFIENSKSIMKNSLMFNPQYGIIIQQYTFLLNTMIRDEVYPFYFDLFSQDPVYYCTLVQQGSLDLKSKCQVMDSFKVLFNEYEFVLFTERIQQLKKQQKRNPLMNFCCQTIDIDQSIVSSNNYNPLLGYNPEFFFEVQQQFIHQFIQVMDNQFIVKLIEILKLLPKETSKYSAYIHFADKLYFESICEILQQSFEVLIQKFQESDIKSVIQYESLPVFSLFIDTANQLKNDNEIWTYETHLDNLTHFFSQTTLQYLINIEQFNTNSSLFKFEFVLEYLPQFDEDICFFLKHSLKTNHQKIVVESVPSVDLFISLLSNFFQEITSFPLQLNYLQKFFIQDSTNNTIQLINCDDLLLFMSQSQDKVYQSCNNQIQVLNHIKQVFEVVVDNIFSQSIDQELDTLSVFLSSTPDFSAFGSYDKKWQCQGQQYISSLIDIQILTKQQVSNITGQILIDSGINQVVNHSPELIKKSLNRQMHDILKWFKLVSLSTISSNPLKEIVHLQTMHRKFEFFLVFISEKLCPGRMFSGIFSYNLQDVIQLLRKRIQSILFAIQSLVLGRCYSLLEFVHQICYTIKYLSTLQLNSPEQWQAIREFLDDLYEPALVVVNKALEQAVLTNEVYKSFLFINANFHNDQYRRRKDQSFYTQFEKIFIRFNSIPFNVRFVVDASNLYKLLYSQNCGYKAIQCINSVKQSIEQNLLSVKTTLLDHLGEKRSQLSDEMKLIIDKQELFCRRIPSVESSILDISPQIENQLSFYNNLIQSTNDFQQKCKQFQSDEENLGLSITDFTAIEQNFILVQLVHEMWLISDNFITSYPHLLDTPFIELREQFDNRSAVQDDLQVIQRNAIAIQQKLQTQVNLITDKSNKQLKNALDNSFDMMQIIFDDLDWFLFNYELFVALSYPFLQKRHLEQLDQQNIKIDVNLDTPLKLKTVGIFSKYKIEEEDGKYKLSDDSLQIVKIYHIATKENEIDEQFSSIEVYWKLASLVSSDGKIFVGLNDMISNIKKDLVLIKSLSQNKFALPNIRKIQTLQDKLELCSNFLILLHSVQNKVIFLSKSHQSGLFSDVANEIDEFFTGYKTLTSSLLKMQTLFNIQQTSGTVSQKDYQQHNLLKCGQAKYDSISLSLFAMPLLIQFDGLCIFLIQTIFECVSQMQKKNKYLLKIPINQFFDLITFDFDGKELDEHVAQQLLSNVITTIFNGLRGVIKVQQNSCSLQVTSLFNMLNEELIITPVVITNNHQTWLQKLDDEIKKQNEIEFMKLFKVQEELLFEQQHCNQILHIYLIYQLLFCQKKLFIGQINSVQEIRHQVKLYIDYYRFQIDKIDIISINQELQYFIDFFTNILELPENEIKQYIFQSNSQSLFLKILGDKLCICNHSGFTCSFCWEFFVIEQSTIITPEIQTYISQTFSLSHYYNVIYLQGKDRLSQIPIYVGQLLGYSVEIIQASDSNVSFEFLENHLLCAAQCGKCVVLNNIQQYADVIVQQIIALAQQINTRSNGKFHYKKQEYSFNQKCLIILSTKNNVAKYNFDNIIYVKYDNTLYSTFFEQYIDQSGQSSFKTDIPLVVKTVELIQDYFNTDIPFQYHLFVFKMVKYIIQLFPNISRNSSLSQSMLLVYRSLFTEDNQLILERIIESQFGFSNLLFTQSSHIMTEIPKYMKSNLQAVLCSLLAGRHTIIQTTNNQEQFYQQLQIIYEQCVNKKVKIHYIYADIVQKQDLFGRHHPDTKLWMSGIIEDIQNQFLTDSENWIIIYNHSNNNHISPLFDDQIILQNGRCIYNQKFKIIMEVSSQSSLEVDLKKKAIIISYDDDSILESYIFSLDSSTFEFERLKKMLSLLNLLFMFCNQEIGIPIRRIQYNFVSFLNSLKLFYPPLGQIDTQFWLDILIYLSLSYSVASLLKTRSQQVQFENLFRLLIKYQDGVQNEQFQDIILRFYKNSNWARKYLQNIQRISPKFFYGNSQLLQKSDLSLTEGKVILGIDLCLQLKNNSIDLVLFDDLNFSHLGLQQLESFIPSTKTNKQFYFWINILFKNQCSIICDDVINTKFLFNDDNYYKKSFSNIIIDDNYSTQYFYNQLSYISDKVIGADPFYIKNLCINFEALNSTNQQWQFDSLQILSNKKLFIDNQSFDICNIFMTFQGSTKVIHDKLLNQLVFLEKPPETQIDKVVKFHFNQFKFDSNINNVFIDFIEQFCMLKDIPQKYLLSIVLTAVERMSLAFDIVMVTDIAKKFSYQQKLFLFELENQIDQQLNQMQRNIMNDTYLEIKQRFAPDDDNNKIFNYLMQSMSSKEVDEMIYCQQHMQTNQECVEKYKYYLLLQRHCYRYVQLSKDSFIDEITYQIKKKSQLSPYMSSIFKQSLINAINALCKSSVIVYGQSGSGKKTLATCSSTYLNYDYQFIKSELLWDSLLLENIKKSLQQDTILIVNPLSQKVIADVKSIVMYGFIPRFLTNEFITSNSNIIRDTFNLLFSNIDFVIATRGKQYCSTIELQQMAIQIVKRNLHFIILTDDLETYSNLPICKVILNKPDQELLKLNASKDSNGNDISNLLPAMQQIFDIGILNFKRNNNIQTMDCDYLKLFSNFSNCFGQFQSEFKTQASLTNAQQWKNFLEKCYISSSTYTDISTSLTNNCHQLQSEIDTEIKLLKKVSSDISNLQTNLNQSTLNVQLQQEIYDKLKQNFQQQNSIQLNYFSTLVKKLLDNVTVLRKINLDKDVTVPMMSIINSLSFSKTEVQYDGNIDSILSPLLAFVEQFPIFMLNDKIYNAILQFNTQLELMSTPDELSIITNVVSEILQLYQQLIVGKLPQYSDIIKSYEKLLQVQSIQQECDIQAINQQKQQSQIKDNITRLKQQSNNDKNRSDQALKIKTLLEEIQRATQTQNLLYKDYDQVLTEQEMVGNSLFAAYYLNFAMGKIDTNIQTQIMQIFSQYNIKHSLSDHVQPKDLFDNNHKLIRLWKQQCLPGDSMIDLIAYQIYFILKYFQEIPLIFDSNAVLLQWLQKLNTSSELLNPVLNGCDEQLQTKIKQYSQKQLIIIDISMRIPSNLTEIISRNKVCLYCTDNQITINKQLQKHMYILQVPIINMELHVVDQFLKQYNCDNITQLTKLSNEIQTIQDKEQENNLSLFSLMDQYTLFNTDDRDKFNQQIVLLDGIKRYLQTSQTLSSQISNLQSQYSSINQTEKYESLIIFIQFVIQVVDKLNLQELYIILINDILAYFTQLIQSQSLELQVLIESVFKYFIQILYPRISVENQTCLLLLYLFHKSSNSYSNSFVNDCLSVVLNPNKSRKLLDASSKLSQQPIFTAQQLSTFQYLVTCHQQFQKFENISENNINFVELIYNEDVDVNVCIPKLMVLFIFDKYLFQQYMLKVFDVLDINLRMDLETVVFQPLQIHIGNVLQLVGVQPYELYLYVLDKHSQILQYSNEWQFINEHSYKGNTLVHLCKVSDYSKNKQQIFDQCNQYRFFTLDDIPNIINIPIRCNPLLLLVEILNLNQDKFESNQQFFNLIVNIVLLYIHLFKVNNLQQNFNKGRVQMFINSLHYYWFEYRIQHDQLEYLLASFLKEVMKTHQKQMMTNLNIKQILNLNCLEVVIDDLFVIENHTQKIKALDFNVLLGNIQRSCQFPVFSTLYHQNQVSKLHLQNRSMELMKFSHRYLLDAVLYEIQSSAIVTYSLFKTLLSAIMIQKCVEKQQQFNQFYIILKKIMLNDVSENEVVCQLRQLTDQGKLEYVNVSVAIGIRDQNINLKVVNLISMLHQKVFEAEIQDFSTDKLVFVF